MSTMNAPWICTFTSVGNFRRMRRNHCSDCVCTDQSKMCGWMDNRACSSMGPNKAASMPIEPATRNELWHESMGIKQVAELLSQSSHTKRTMVLGITETSRCVIEI